MVKAFIKRRVPQDKARDMIPLFRKMRSMAMEQPGYISGETLKNYNDPEEYLVISVWQSAEDWQSWLESKERQRIQDQIDELLGGRTEYSLYAPGV
jgi:heme-degrading monooxygenase HmoA